MLQQTLEIKLVEVVPVTIHGSPYYEIAFQPADDEAAPPQKLRINPEAFYADPKPGDRVAVNILMGNIMGAEKIG